jgi:hypothetical protein
MKIDVSYLWLLFTCLGANMKLLTLATALVAGSLLISVPAFAEDEAKAAAAPEAKHEMSEADHKATDTHAKKEVKKVKKAKKAKKAETVKKDAKTDAAASTDEAAKHEATETK